MPTSVGPFWQRVIRQLREVIPERTIENWLVKAVPESVDTEGPSANVVLRVPSRFCKDYLLSNFRGKIEKAASEANGQPVELTLRVDPSLPDESSNEESSTPGDQEPASLESTDSSLSSPSDFSKTDSRGQPPSPSDSASNEQQEPPSPARETQDQTSPERSPPNLRRRSDSPVASRTSTPVSSEEPLPPESVDPGRNSSTTNASPVRERNQKSPASVGAPARDLTDSTAEDTADHFQFSEAEQRLHPEFTFEQFLEGDSNRLARSASVAVAKKPGDTKYNPLVVYGEVGLGKTHLAQAIANHALEYDTASTICYVSSERFTSEFVTAIRNDNFGAFSSHYRNVDLLVVDDVQFFGGKEKTQEEFFHLFNDLHQHGKQIVLCADRPPSQISGIEDRLLSRFQWGLTADIQQPDLEMRMAVLQLKAENLDLDLNPDVIEIIAQNITENVRQLEGALKQLAARAQLINGTVDAKTARNILEREYGVGTEPQRAEVEDIIEGVASYYSISSDELVSRTRRQKISNARQVAMYLSRGMTNLSYASIGLRFGGRDHSTVIHACNKVEDQLEVLPEFEEELNSVRSEIREFLYSK